MSKSAKTLDAIIPLSFCGERIDKVLAALFPQYSRARLNHWLKEKQITVDGRYLKAKDKVKGGEAVHAHLLDEELTELVPQEINLDILFEDQHLMVVNKQAGLVVHPGAGNPDKTLVNGLLHHNENLAQLPRAGIIHRLDKDTTGCLIIAKTLAAHHQLVCQMQAREIERQYYALVHGRLSQGGRIETHIKRHPINRKKMAVADSGKLAVTHYSLKKIYANHSLLDIKLETGRTHQIRVHMAHIKHPIVGDMSYGKLKSAYNLKFERQALHAYRIRFLHPQTKELIDLEAPLPDDLKNLIKLIENDSQ